MLSYRSNKGLWIKTGLETELINETCPVCNANLHYPTYMVDSTCPKCHAPLVAAKLLKSKEARLRYHIGKPIIEKAGDDDDDDEDAIREYYEGIVGAGGYTS